MFPPSAEVSGVKVAKELCILSKGHAVSETGKEKLNEANKRLEAGQKQAYKHYSRFSYHLILKKCLNNNDVYLHCKSQIINNYSSSPNGL